MADPSGDTLSEDLRGWWVQAQNGFGKDIKVEFSRILNSIMHINYLSIDNTILDVQNDDLTERYRVDRDVLSAGIARLILEFDDCCLVACALAERGSSKDLERVAQGKEWSFISASGPWGRDPWSIIARIRYFPKLEDRVWNTHFARYATSLGSRDIINHSPFTMSTWQSVWKIGWRRDDLFADPRVRLDDLIKTVRDYATD